MHRPTAKPHPIHQGWLPEEDYDRLCICQSTTQWTERGIPPDVTGHDQPWATWKTLNGLWVGEGRCKASMKKWKLACSEACVCGKQQTMDHIMRCTYCCCTHLCQPLERRDIEDGLKLNLKVSQIFCHL